VNKRGQKVLGRPRLPHSPPPKGRDYALGEAKLENAGLQGTVTGTGNGTLGIKGFNGSREKRS